MTDILVIFITLYIAIGVIAMYDFPFLMNSGYEKVTPFLVLVFSLVFVLGVFAWAPYFIFKWIDNGGFSRFRRKEGNR